MTHLFRVLCGLVIVLLILGSIAGGIVGAWLGVAVALVITAALVWLLGDS